MKKIVLLDNGHGSNTPGKCSPDRRLLEYAYTREIAQKVMEELKAKGIDCRRIVTETTDISLGERCRRVNKICSEVGKGNVILISIHNNAAGNGGWKTAKGWSGWVYNKCSEESKKLANCLYDAVDAMKLPTRKPMPNQKYWSAGFYILKNTNCPAVLTENFFQDNKEEVDWLLSDAGKKAVVKLHMDGILKYMI